MSERVCVSVCVYDAHDSHTFFLPKSYAEKSYPWVPLCTLECVITWVEVICPSVDAVFCFVSLFTHRTEKVFRKVLRTRQQRKFLHCGKRNTQRRSIAITVNPPGIVLSTGAFPLRWQMFTISVRVVFTEGKYLCDDDIKKIETSFMRHPSRLCLTWESVLPAPASFPIVSVFPWSARSKLMEGSTQEGLLVVAERHHGVRRRYRPTEDGENKTPCNAAEKSSFWVNEAQNTGMLGLQTHFHL